MRLHRALRKVLSSISKMSHDQPDQYQELHESKVAQKVINQPKLNEDYRMDSTQNHGIPVPLKSSEQEIVPKKGRRPVVPSAKPKSGRSKCTKCHKMVSSSLLESHMAKHATGYSCKICLKSFVCKDNLSRHERIHTGNRPHACTYCNFRSTQLCVLKRHIKFIHTDILIEQPYSCKYCGYHSHII